MQLHLHSSMFLMAWCLIKHMESFSCQCGEFVVCVVILVTWTNCELSILHIEDKLWNFCAVCVLQHASQSTLQLVFQRLEACVSPFFCKMCTISDVIYIYIEDSVTLCYAQKHLYSSIQNIWSLGIWHSALTDMLHVHVLDLKPLFGVLSENLFLQIIVMYSYSVLYCNFGVRHLRCVL